LLATLTPHSPDRVDYQGGFSMHKFSKAAAAVAAAGLAVLGTVAASGGVASAAVRDQSVTGCDLGNGLLTAGLAASCDAPPSTVLDPTSITVSVDPSYLTVLGTNAVAQLLGGLNLISQNVTYNLSCVVDGAAVTKAESFTATPTASTQSQTVDLQSAVGSPVPNSCQVTDLKASSLLSLNSTVVSLLQTLHLLTNLSFGVQATAHTAVPGAIWMQAGQASSGLTADLCTDVANNGNQGTPVQSYQCNSDLAQYWVQASTGQLVHNGDCLTQSGSDASLELCSATNNAQRWQVQGTGGHWGKIINASTGACLTAKAQNFAVLKALGCNGGADQKWTGPAKSAV
jgi:hypothetical protein